MRARDERMVTAPGATAAPSPPDPRPLAPDSCFSPPRPAWLLDPPRPLAQPPAALCGTPERIESGWWDDADCRRDYYVADAGDMRLWVFQDLATRQWYLHGLWG
jgi:protein ImuB